MDEEVREEDAADVKARKQAAAKAREEAELRQRSQVHCSNLLQISVRVIPEHALCVIFISAAWDLLVQMTVYHSVLHCKQDSLLTS